MTHDRAHMHLDTVFTMLDRDVVTVFPNVARRIHAYSIRPGDGDDTFDVRAEESFLDAVADALDVKELRIVDTGGDDYQAAREQWDDANNTVALEPGVVIGYEKNTHTIRNMRKAGMRVIPDPGLRAGQGPRRRPLHDVSAAARRDLAFPPNTTVVFVIRLGSFDVDSENA